MFSSPGGLRFATPSGSTKHHMDTLAQESSIIQKTLELCQAVVEQPDFRSVKEKLDAFMADELAKFQFQQFNDLGGLLQMKQSHGVDPNDEEVARYEALRAELMKNPVTQGFLDAQQELQKLHEAIGRFVNKTFELGRKPSYEDVHDGSCNSCGCH
jgi:cell fate (sporulation/competence/biofilm development) regulator YlbF (YheA/YmcA/DUF963 family)